MSTGSGRPISKKEALDILKKRSGIMDETSKIMPGICQLMGKKVAGNYYSAGANAFIFDKALIEDLLRPRRDLAGADVQADCVVVILGAQPKDDGADIKEGQPTVIITACIRGSDRSLTSLNIDEPAVEHPPTELMETFPIVDVGNSLTFDIV